jgi:hypothetical protein
MRVEVFAAVALSIGWLEPIEIGTQTAGRCVRQRQKQKQGKKSRKRRERKEKRIPSLVDVLL